MRVCVCALYASCLMCFVQLLCVELLNFIWHCTSAVRGGHDETVLLVDPVQKP